MFSAQDRDRVQDQVLELATADPRIVAGAVVGSLADGSGDRWSDLDLSFGVSDDSLVADVLEDWTDRLTTDFDALHLFDLRQDATIYRVFLLSGGLQLDVSFTPAAAFGATGPRFRLLFGHAVEKPRAAQRSAEELFGWAVVYAHTGRACIDRGREWQAEYCISEVRNHGLVLACRRLDLPMSFGRGFDDLPAEVLAGFDDALVRSLTRDELLRALRAAVDGLLHEASQVKEMALVAEPRMREWLAS